LTYLLQSEELKTNDWKDISKKFVDAKVKNCAELSGRGLFYPVDEHAPLLIIIDLMIAKKIHRFPIIDCEGNLISIITQSHIVELVAKNRYKLFDFTYNKTIIDLNLGLKDVISITSDQPTVNAFQTIYNKKILGIAVVEQGKLIGNISASDVKSILTDENMTGLSNLYIPCGQFVREVIKITQLFTVSTNFSLLDVFLKFESTKAHRLYIVDDDGRPLGVISLVDALEALRRTVF